MKRRRTLQERLAARFGQLDRVAPRPVRARSFAGENERLCRQLDVGEARVAELSASEASLRLAFEEAGVGIAIHGV